MSHARKVATHVALRLQAHNYLGVFAGGCVRDWFLGVEPKDFDVATNATPEQILKVFEGYNVLTVGAQFGIIVVVIEGVNIEVATLRNDGQYGDGRHPDKVVFLNSCSPIEALQGDAARRDLTINAMFEDPATGEIYDFFGGQDDLKNRIIRAVGDASQRFAEDRLRMLRVVRFAAKLGFRVDDALLAALKKHARDLKPGSVVSWERIAVELKGILTSKAPVVGLDLLWETGLMAEVLPEAMALVGWRAFQDPIWHPEGSTKAHTWMVVNVGATREGMASHLAAFADDEHITQGIEESTQSFALRLALLLHDFAKPRTQSFRLVRRTRGWLRFLLPFRLKVSNYGHAEKGAEMARAICRRLKLSNEVTDRVEEIVLMHMQMHEFNNPVFKRSKLVRLMQRASIFDLIVMQHCDVMGTARTKAERESSSLMTFYLKLMAEMRADPVESRRPGANELLTGKHIIAAGFKAGPIFRAIKEAALEAQHGGDFTDEQGAVAWLTERLEHFRAIVPTLVQAPSPHRGRRKDCC